jgi:hypothetical protein
MDRLINDVALLREELRIKDARIAKIDPRRRPYYPAAERMAILELKAARAFFVEPDTIAEWLRRIDQDGSSALVQLPEPVNKFPDFVRHVVQRLKALCLQPPFHLSAARPITPANPPIMHPKVAEPAQTAAVWSRKDASGLVAAEKMCSINATLMKGLTDEAFLLSGDRGRGDAFHSWAC